MKKQLLLIALSTLVTPVTELQAQPLLVKYECEEISFTIPIVTVLATSYILGNIYARVVTERAAHYRFSDEIELLQKEDLDDDTLKEEFLKVVLNKHYKNVHKSFKKRWSEILRLLPTSKVPDSRKAFPLTQHEDDLNCYLNSIWWCQWWTIFQSKYNDLEKLKNTLAKAKEMILTNYKYTKEQQIMYTGVACRNWLIV